MLAAISPHLDDAVFACGELIAAYPGAAVITVFAGIPEASQALTDWDSGCGFSASGDAVRARRREDAAALALLGATPCWLDFYDAQYARRASEADISAALARELERHAAETVALPLGLFHSDHQLVSRAALALIDERRTWLAYEDALYRRIPGAVQKRLGALGMRASPMAARECTALKQRAVRCYASQLRGLDTPGRPGCADLGEPERYWRLGK